MNEEQAALTIQRFFRAHLSRKKTNSYGSSQGKEIEIYLPFGLSKKGTQLCSTEHMYMLGGYKTMICKSDLFSIQIEYMKFRGAKRPFSIPEIVTAPFRSPEETNSNLPTEEEIDSAVDDFIALLQKFTSDAASQGKQRAFVSLDCLMDTFNAAHARHPLSMSSLVRKYLENPVRKKLFTDKKIPVPEHHMVDICFIYEPEKFPRFDLSATPRTFAAAEIISDNLYSQGKLLLHVQKTYSLPVENYHPDFLAIDKNPSLHNTPQQLVLLGEARRRAELFIEAHPLPKNANRARVLGLLTICAEKVITVVYAKAYQNLHEKADRPVLSIRHTLHYVKKMICNEAERQWFNNMFCNHRDDIDTILCENQYSPDYRGRDCHYGDSRGLSQGERYDVIFDLFGDFSNGEALTLDDVNNPLSVKECQQLEKYGITSWKNLYKNHLSLSGRTHLRLQKVGDHYEPLFEARRIGVMTPEEFRQGESRVYLHQDPGSSLSRL
jgi:hypothetical protein